MEYIKIQCENGLIAYQKVYQGNVLCCYDELGNIIDLSGIGSIVIDANPPIPSWVIEEPSQPAPGFSRSHIITKLEFLNRLTDEETAYVFEAAKTNILIEVWIKKFELAEEINLEDERLRGGLVGLEQAGILQPGRANEILNA
jgi:hypothetical protein